MVELIDLELEAAPAFAEAAVFIWIVDAIAFPGHNARIYGKNWDNCCALRRYWHLMYYLYAIGVGMSWH